MNKNSRKLGLYIALALVFSAAAATFRTIALLTNLEDNLIYFDDKRLITISYVIALVGLAVLVSAFFVTEKVSLRARFASPSAIVPTGLLAAAMLLFAKECIMWVARYSPKPFLASLNTPATVLAFSAALITPLAITHLVLTFLVTERHKALRAYFSLALILLLAVHASFLYFDTTTPLNDSSKIIDQMAYLFTAIFFLYEARISLGREMWRSYSAFGLIALLLAIYASVPEILVFIIRGSSVAVSIEASILLFALALFILSRLVLTASLREDAESSEMSVLRAYAEARDGAIAAGAVAEAMPEDGTQMTIDDIISEIGEADESESAEQPEAIPEEIFLAEPISEDLLLPFDDSIANPVSGDAAEPIAEPVVEEFTAPTEELTETSLDEGREQSAEDAE